MQQATLRLISHKLCPYVQRARIVLAEKNIPHEIVFVDLANKRAWFRAVSPLGRVPVLLVDRVPLFESAVIAEYLDEISPGSLHPENPLEKAHNRSWIEFASVMLGDVANFYRAPDGPALERAGQSLQERFEQVEANLADGPWFNGGEFSLVDAAFGPLFRYFDTIEHYADFRFFDRTPRVQQWRSALARRPSVQSAVVADYPQRLERFFLDLDSELTRLIEERLNPQPNADSREFRGASNRF